MYSGTTFNSVDESVLNWPDSEGRWWCKLGRTGDIRIAKFTIAPEQPWIDGIQLDDGWHTKSRSEFEHVHGTSQFVKCEPIPSQLQK